MPSIKAKTHKGVKKRFKVTATGKVTHKKCGSSHLNSGKSGSKIRNMRRKGIIKVNADAHRLRRALRTRESSTPNQPEANPTPADDAPTTTETA